LADTRRLQQDELHKRSIATQIKEHIDSVTAVLVLVNGTVPRITVGSNYALSVLSTIFPNTVANNVALLFTNVTGPIYLNFPTHTLPSVLKDAPQFLLNNPVALQRKYLKLKGDPCMKTGRPDFRKAVKAGEENALGLLVDLFDWLDRLEPQPMTNIVPLYQEDQDVVSMIADAHAPMDQVVAMKANDSAVSRPSCLYLKLGSYAD
jgi:hypothetical protein